MVNTKNNARWRENERRMETELLALLRDKSIEHITVKEICERAHVNRSTFYAHFTDIYDMLEQMESHLHEELMAAYKRLGGAGHMIFTSIVFLHHVRDHQFFYRSVLRTRRDFPIEQGFDEMMEEVVRPRCASAGVTDEAEVLYYFTAFQAAFTMVLRRWVEDGCRENAETMATVLRNCVPAIWKEEPR